MGIAGCVTAFSYRIRGIHKLKYVGYAVLS